MSQNQERSHGESAVYLHQMEGYNCAQAIVSVYAPIVGVDTVTIYKLAEGFGSGTGRLQGMCGVISAVTMIIGFHCSNGNMEIGGPRSKVDTYKISSAFTKAFNDRFGTIICSQLKNPRLDTFTPCVELIRFGCQWLDHYLENGDLD